MLKVVFEMDEFLVYRNRTDLIHWAIRGKHAEVVQYLLRRAKYEPHSILTAFRSATKSMHIPLIAPFFKCDSTQHWALDPRAVLQGVLFTGNVALLNSALENGSFVRVLETSDPAIIREVLYQTFLHAMTAEDVALPEWHHFLERTLDLPTLSYPIITLHVFELSMELNRSRLLLPILHRCPNIDIRFELEDDDYEQIIETRFLSSLLPFVLVNESDLRYLLMRVASHDYKEKPHNRKVDFESVYDHASNVRRIPMSTRMYAAQLNFNKCDFVLALRLIDDDENGRLAKMRIARESGFPVVDRYLTGIHLTFALHLLSDDHDYWLPQEIKHYIIKTYLDSQQ